MIKHIAFIRHAKSAWDDFSLPDIQRPLNKRGNKNADEMAKTLFAQGYPIEALYVSTAQRTRETARYFANAYQLDNSSLFYEPSLYLSDKQHYLDIIHLADDTYNAIAIIGHNPTMEEIAVAISGIPREFPTCACLFVNCDIRQWADFSYNNAHEISFTLAREL